MTIIERANDEADRNLSDKRLTPRFFRGCRCRSLERFFILNRSCFIEKEVLSSFAMQKAGGYISDTLHHI
jgi:hypothetical protein